MNRYTKSFSITIVLYVLVSITFLYSFDKNDTLPSQQTKSDQSVKFTIIQEAHEKKSVEKKPHKKIVKKEIPKKVIEKKYITKKILPKKKKEIIKKVEKIVKKEQKKSYQLEKKQIRKNDTTVKNEKQIIDNTKQNKQNIQIYYSQIKERINTNKSYPKMAIKRGIEGVVKVQFTISKNGELLSFHIIEGKRIFKKSISEAVKNSFPLTPPKNLLTKNTSLSLMINYRLY